MASACCPGGPLVGFLFGWTLFLVVDTGSIATLAVAFSSKYLPLFVMLPAWGEKLVSAAIVAALVAVNHVGARWGANLYALPTEAIAGSDRLASDAMSMAIGPVAASVIAVVILFSITGANQNLLCSPRSTSPWPRTGFSSVGWPTSTPASPRLTRPSWPWGRGRWC